MVGDSFTSRKHWLKACKENIQWAEKQLKEATDVKDRFHWKWLITINKRQLKELEPQQPRPVKYKGTSPIQKIKQTVDIIDVIGLYTPLRGNGRQYYGHCPFHKDHSPSLSVDRGKQLWHCFPCDKGGDVIDFVKQVGSLDTRDAIKWIARNI